MILRVELVKGRSAYFQHAVNLCRKSSSYKETTENGVVTHSAEFDADTEMKTFGKILRIAAWWIGASFYVDGKETSPDDLFKLVYPDEFKEYIQLPGGARIDKRKVVEAEKN